MKIFLGFFLLVCVIAFTIFFTSPVTQGQKEDKDEATVVFKGQVTEKERKYSKVYEKEYDSVQGEKLSRMRGTQLTILEPSVPGSPYEAPLTAERLLNRLACNADLVIVGSVTGKAAHLTENESFVYTEYNLTVDEIIKNNEIAPVETKKEIEVVRPGGVIKLENRVIKVTDKSFAPLNTNNKYLLFLKFVPDTGGYRAFNTAGDFQIVEKGFNKITGKALPDEMQSGMDAESLKQRIFGAVSLGCKTNAASSPIR